MSILSRYFAYCLGIIFYGVSFCTWAYSQDASQQPSVEISKIIPPLEEYVRQLMADWQIPGASIGIIQGDQLIYVKGFGTKEVDTSQPIDSETLFPLASTTKAFGAAVLAAFVDQGLLKWDEKVVNYDRSFMLYDPWVTRQFQIVDLFAQHSGLPASCLTNLIVMSYKASYVLDVLRYIKPETSFRSQFAYQNALQLELESLSKILTGKSWDIALKKTILDPLGMQRTFAKVADFNRSENHTSCHVRSKGKVKAIPLVRYLDGAGPSGGMTSCVQDMAKWLSMQLANGKFREKQIISEKNLQMTRTPQTIIKAAQFYALGWVIDPQEPYTIIWHNGEIECAKAFVGFSPEANVGIVILCNLGENTMPEAAGFRFFDLAFKRSEKDYNTQYQKSARDKAQAKKKEEEPPSFSNALPLESYAGKYHSDVFGMAVLTVKDDKLHLKIQTDQAIEHDDLEATLMHWNRDTFVAEWEGFLRSIDFDEGNKVIFSGGPQGKIKAFHYYLPNQTSFIFERQD
ncbi:serine hydrolase [Candidatus Protochlamydia phocaeensis]|uniref:serine hydrolase n=1 Tax=Candidatus Protochlamydia phocaeensis TaxID=1414722 RepID=UPI0008380AB6|nr:serine hydrolase [Candidatus Protochlamydia phocaeensis]